MVWGYACAFYGILKKKSQFLYIADFFVLEYYKMYR